jgi:hypothetical protein
MLSSRHRGLFSRISVSAANNLRFFIETSRVFRELTADTYSIDSLP